MLIYLVYHIGMLEINLNDMLNVSKAGFLRKAKSSVAMFSAFQLAFVLPVQSVMANPAGGVVGSGQATINQTTTSHTTINQITDRVVIDWDSFDINAGEITEFVQPSAASAALNRVHDVDASIIAGQLKANGNVMVINPNGVAFTGTSKVDVGGLVVSTADVDNSNFMAGGKLEFNQAGNADGSIINNGEITIKQAGVAAFVAPRVENNGIIRADMGKIALASGDAFTLDMYGDKLLAVTVSDEVAAKIISNNGTLSANGGAVYITAGQAKNAVDNLINIDGVIEANSISEVGGKIIITADGGDVLLGDNAIISANGELGGGTINIGGDYLGGGDIDRAENVYAAADTKITANTTGENGSGGRVIVWSENKTIFAGEIEAKGGSASGDGGFVETSSRNVLQATGNVDASAGNTKR